MVVRRLKTKFRLSQPRARRPALKAGLIGCNVVFLGVALLFVTHRAGAGSSSQPALASSSAAAVSSPLDQLASADIAVAVARLGNLPEATAITNQADSSQAELSLAATDNNVVAKSQVVATALKSRADIQTYSTKAGDTVAKIAAKFGVSPDSIIWSNNLNSASVAPNVKLEIPPVNGIVYTVQKGDTAASLAAKYHVDKSHIIAFNDAEIAGLKPGERIVIPSGRLDPVASVGASYAASDSNDAGQGQAITFPWGRAPVYGYNGYDYGYCTWYVASQVPIPSNWGNAATWSYYAPLSGWGVSHSPRVGAVAQTPFAAGGEGHVAIVEAVRGNMIKISDMNGIAGWGNVGTGWQPISKFPNYIYR